jgi:tetratricopeptide (TPR) repeat protein
VVPDLPQDFEMVPTDGYERPAPREAVFVRLAEAYRKEGLLEDAARICRDGLARFPESWPGRIVLGKILLEQGATEEAYGELDQVRREVRGRPEILVALEEVLKGAPPIRGVSPEPVEPDVLILDSPEEMGPAQDEEHEAASHDPLASPTLARLYASQGDSAKADAILRQLGEKDRPAGTGGQSEKSQAQQQFLKSLSAYRNVAQRERRTRSS